ncbi:MAG TPA: hypothetical protein VIV11_34845 [Kofleriaceae bacterium]
MRYVAVIAFVIACGDGGAAVQDAAIDTAPQDAATDPDADAPPTGHYVIDRVNLPTSSALARTYAFDLDNNTSPDNALGQLIANLPVGLGLYGQNATTAAIDRGDVIMLADVGADDYVNDPMVTFTLYQGENPMPMPCSSAQDPVCRRHLAGTGSFSINAAAPIDPRLSGSIGGGQLSAGPGHLTVQLTFADSPTITVTLLSARADLTSTTATLSGRIGGAISPTDVTTKIIPALSDGFQAIVAQECTMLSNPPSCGCPQSSRGEMVKAQFDTNQDCNISVGEVQSDSLVSGLLAPDVTVESMQAVSFAFGLHAVTGAFTDPQ